MVRDERWRTAQEYEADFWADAADRISAGETPELRWYEWRAERLLERLETLDRSDASGNGATVLEVGSGPVGVTSFLPATTRLSLDPLQRFYSSKDALKAPRADRVLFVEGVGESLPVPDVACDLVIIENCIDHVKDIDGVMRELRRVLRDDGVLYLTVNCRTTAGYFVHRALSTLKLDPGHPHTFTVPRIRRLVQQYGFDILWADRESYLSSTLSDLTDRGMRGKVKAVLGISEFTMSLIATRHRESQTSMSGVPGPSKRK